MARVKYAALVSEISGSIGSATFQKSLYGNTLRSKPKPRLSSTASQLSCRAIMMQLHQAWSALSSDQRRQWNQFLSYSNATIKRDRSILLTGHSLFIKYNYLRILTSQSIYTDIVYSHIEPWPVILDIAHLAGNLVFVVDHTPSDSNNWFVLKLTTSRPAAQSFSQAGLRYTPIVWAELLIFPIDASYESIFGSIPPIGASLHYELQWFSLLSPVMSPILRGVIQVSEIV
jgi:hypothetical protein